MKAKTKDPMNVMNLTEWERDMDCEAAVPGTQAGVSWIAKWVKNVVKGLVFGFWVAAAVYAGGLAAGFLVKVFVWGFKAWG